MIKEFALLLYGIYTGRKKRINPARRIAFTFAVIILAGAVLLMLPLSNEERVYTPFLSALFTATSATCVTGLALFDTGAYFSYFGQAVILMLIQIGGFGFMTVVTMAFVAAHKNIGIRSRMLIAQSLGLNDMSGGVRLIKSVVKFTFFSEFCGAVLLMFRFVPIYGIKGIWYGVFHSVSAFCNAGFDIFGTGDSLMNFSSDAYTLIIIAALIICGGLGFIVWNEIFIKKSFRRLSAYAKLVIIITAALLISGMVLFVITERDFSATGVLNAFFQSVTTRTAGFDATGQSELSESGKFVSVILMMIGGASGSTAGGVKVVTFGVLLIAAMRTLRGKRNIVIFNRSIASGSIFAAMSLLVLWMVLAFSGTVFVSAADGVSVLDALFETVSAYGTVGLSVGVTGQAGTAVKILFIIYMFFGRIGLMTISMMFMTRRQENTELVYPRGDMFIG